MFDGRAIIPAGRVCPKRECLSQNRHFPQSFTMSFHIAQIVEDPDQTLNKDLQQKFLGYHAQDDLLLTKGTLLRHLTPWSEAYSWSWTPSTACIVFSPCFVRHPRCLDCTYVECFACLPPAYHRSKIQRVISTQDLCRLQLLHAASCHKFVIWTRVEANRSPPVKPQSIWTVLAAGNTPIPVITEKACTAGLA